MDRSTSPILWQNKEQNVTLVDVPRSIIAAQSTGERLGFEVLLSSEPIATPHPSQEPKTEAARIKLVNNTTDEGLHAEYRDLLQQALEDVKRQHHHDWCLRRVFIRHVATQTRVGKRKLSNHDAPESFEAPGKTLKESSTRKPHHEAGDECASSSRQDLAAQETHAEYEVDDSRFQANYNTTRMKYQIISKCNKTYEGESNAIYMPPYSSFFLADCYDSRAFHRIIRNQAQAHDTRRHFDFILLDPPWPNRSVKRASQTPTAGYAVASTMGEAKRMILGADLDMLMADHCLVGVWITNKPAVRELVTGRNGIFAEWGLKLEEEWIWLKTTVHGEPIFALDSLWRKPYEILLLARKERQLSADALPGYDETTLKRRVIISVPDRHSRKPCLKELIEPFMPNSTDYRALEVFARHLVAGWCSWGDDCIRFNKESEWRSMEDVNKGSDYITTPGR